MVDDDALHIGDGWISGPGNWHRDRDERMRRAPAGQEGFQSTYQPLAEVDLVFEEDLPIAPEPVRIAGTTLLAASRELSLAWKVQWLATDMWPQVKDLHDTALLVGHATVDTAVVRELIRPEGARHGRVRTGAGGAPRRRRPGNAPSELPVIKATNPPCRGGSRQRLVRRAGRRPAPRWPRWTAGSDPSRACRPRPPCSTTAHPCAAARPVPPAVRRPSRGRPGRPGAPPRR